MITPWYSGQTSPLWTPVLTQDGGKAVDLTGVSAASFALNIHNLKSELDQAGTGTFSILSPASNGQIQYIWNVADSATPGHYTLQVSYTDANGRAADCDPILWEVRAKGTLSAP